jgi:hypothetical protein
MLARRIVALLQACQPYNRCDACITTELGLKSSSRVAQVTEALGCTSEFTRIPASCAKCGKQRLAIKTGGTPV